MLKRRKKVVVIPAEKMALLAEKGLKAARLSRAEMLSLTENGLDELYTIKEGIKNPPPPLDQQLIDKVMAKFFPVTSSDLPAPSLTDVCVQLTGDAVKVVKKAFDWQLNSWAFAQRGPESGSVSFYKEAGKLAVHFELTKSGECRTIINVQLTDKSKRKRSSFKATLFQEDQCIESIHVNTNPVASFSNITPGHYLLKVSDNKGEIASVNIRLEK